MRVQVELFLVLNSPSRARLGSSVGLSLSCPSITRGSITSGGPVLDVPFPRPALPILGLMGSSVGLSSSCPSITRGSIASGGPVLDVPFPRPALPILGLMDSSVGLSSSCPSITREWWPSA
jgi:hypothetical protein